MDFLIGPFYKVLLIFVIFPKISNCADCNGNVGENNPQSKDKNVDTGTGVTILLDAQDDEFTVDCCGVIHSWDYYTKVNTGTVYFQVWRKGGSTWSLVGENQHTITSTNGQQTATPTTASRIVVQNGDVLGLHMPGPGVITYDNGHKYKRTTTYSQGTSTFNWDGVAQSDGRDYGFHANVIASTAPQFTNLDSTVTHLDTLAVGTTLLVLTATDADNMDVVTISLTSNSAPALFEYESGTLSVKTKAALTAGTYTMVFRAADICGKTDTFTLTIILTNVPPTINNLPASTDLSEDQTAELILYVIDVTDPSDAVTCSITSPASSPFDIKLNPGSSNPAIYVKANQGLNYLTQRVYTLTIQCTDTKDPVTSTFTVYLLKNAQPAFTNLQNRTEISANTVSGTSFFTVTASDPESDSLTYSLTCNSGSCNFDIFNSGDVRTNADISSLTIPAYDLYINTSDGKTQVGPKTLTVVIKDINTAPVITNLPLPTTISVRENTALDTLLYKVNVLDVNTADTLSFTVSSNPIAGLTYLDINTTSGEVKTSATSTLNYEDLSGSIGTTFTLSIFVSDSKASVSQDLVINVIDINETPAFSKNLYGSNGNEETVGNTFSDPGISVTDPEGDTLTYRMDCGQHSAYFSIDASTAALTVDKAYDLDASSNPALVTCSVTATDGEFTVTATVEITINDINDNLPLFGRSYYTFYITPSTPVNTVIGSISATDADTGTFGTLYYDLDQASLSDEFFGVSGSSVYVKNSLASFYDGQILTITGKVTDGGGLQDTATIYLVMPDTTTTNLVTTTTERYYTFLEDPKNTAWLTAMSVVCIGIIGLMGYLIYSNCIKKRKDWKL